MKCQILFPEKNMKNINLLSAELAQRVVKAKYRIFSINRTYLYKRTVKKFRSLQITGHVSTSL